MYEHSTFKTPFFLVKCYLSFSSQKQLIQALLDRGNWDEIEACQIQNK